MCNETHDEDFDNDSEWDDDEWEDDYEEFIDIDSDQAFDQWIENINRPRATFRKAI